MVDLTDSALLPYYAISLTHDFISKVFCCYELSWRKDLDFILRAYPLNCQRRRTDSVTKACIVRYVYFSCIEVYTYFVQKSKLLILVS
jgi:hypothetical protein